MPRRRQSLEPAKPRHWESLRLEDRIGSGIVVLFVGINPGVRSATIGHHFAGFSNRFWKLLFEARLVPELLRAEDDRRLVEFHYGITNLVPRPTPGIDTLRPAEYVDGLESLKEKVRRWKPPVVAFVRWRGMAPMLELQPRTRTKPAPAGMRTQSLQRGG